MIKDVAAAPPAPAGRAEVEQWRKMDSAPKDASRILIATPDSRVCEAWWARYYESGPGYWLTPPSVTGSGYTILPDYPTNWMPLPAAPAPKEPS